MTDELAAARQRLEAAAAEASGLLSRQIIELTKQGMSIVEISRALRCSTRQVQNAHRASGINPRDYKQRVVDLDKLRDLVGQGLTRNQLAQHFGCHPDMITKARRAAGLPHDKSGAPLVVDPERVRELSEQGQTLRAIAETLSCSKATVIRIKNQLGINNPSKLSTERRAAAEAMLDDDCSFAEIHRTLGISPETLRRHFPGRQWTREQQNEYLRIIRVESGYNWSRQAAA